MKKENEAEVRARSFARRQKKLSKAIAHIEEKYPGVDREA